VIELKDDEEEKDGKVEEEEDRIKKMGIKPVSFVNRAIFTATIYI
jgi:hypothetical protein